MRVSTLPRCRGGMGATTALGQRAKMIPTSKSWQSALNNAVNAAVLPLAIAAMTQFSTSHAAYGAEADWKNFTAITAQNWTTAGSWATAVPVSATTLEIDFDPAKANTTTSSGKISNGFTSNNDIGTVQLNTLNLSGMSSASNRPILIAGGALEFAGTSPSINNTTTTSGTGGLVAYSISSNILLDGNTSVSLGGTGLTTLASATGSTISTNTTGLKTISLSGAGDVAIGGLSGAIISDGSGQVGITMAGTGTLTMGGTNSFTGDLLIKSGTLAQAATSAGTATAFGAATIKLGDTDTLSSATATLQLNRNTTNPTNAIVVQSGSSGKKSIQNITTGSSSMILGGLVTLKDDLTIGNTGGGTGSITIGTSTGASWLTGDKNLITVNNGTGAVALSGTNSTFKGNVIVSTGLFRVASATALSAANTVAVDSLSGATFDLNNMAQTIAGLNDGSNGGGTVTNSGAAVKTLTLGGNSTYSFGGSITATTPANLALSVAITSSGKQTLSGSNSYGGGTSVTSGTLLVNNTSGSGTGSGAVSVSAGATLGGNGSIDGVVTINGLLSPGNSPGALTVKNTVGFGSNSAFVVQLNGTTAGTTGYDQLVINNSSGTGLTIGTGVDLQLSLGFTPAIGNYFAIVNDVTNGDTVSGQFAKLNGVTTSLTDGSTFTLSGKTFRIDYDGIASSGAQSGGNDVLLTVIPEPASLSLFGTVAFWFLSQRTSRKGRNCAAAV